MKPHLRFVNSRWQCGLMSKRRGFLYMEGETPAEAFKLWSHARAHLLAGGLYYVYFDS